MKKITSILILLFTINVIFANNSMLPNVKLKDFSKKKIKMNTLAKDGPILINFWTLACEPCKKEMKYLNNFHNKYVEKGFQVFSINMDTPRSMSKVKSYVRSQKYAFPVLSDPRAELFRKMGGKVMPFVIIADSSGQIINRHVGYTPGEEKELEKEILHLLVPSEIKKDSSQVEIETSVPVLPPSDETTKTAE